MKKIVNIIIGAISPICEAYLNLYRSSNEHYILVDLENKRSDIEKLCEKIDDFDYSIELLDVRNISEIKNLFDRLNENNVKIKKCLYLAGINILKSFEELNEDDWDNVLDTNLKGAFFFIQEAAKNMIINQIEGSIVNISSQHGLVGNISRAAYCASKAGIINMNRSLALELSKYQIRINSISPGFILYEKNRDFLLSSINKKKYLSNVPLGRYCNAEDIADSIDFLLSNKSKMITGQTIVVDGGYTVK